MLKIESRCDGLYLVGNGLLIQISSYNEGLMLMKKYQ
jgi:hypothetical protein